jgi:hypothetical protein
MKKLLLALIILVVSISCYAQPTKSYKEGSETGDLKELVSKYCIIGVYHLTTEWHATIYADRDKLVFLDKTTGKDVAFLSLTEIFNFMDKTGWKYVDPISLNITANDQLTYIFEKRDDKKPTPSATKAVTK